MNLSKFIFACVGITLTLLSDNAFSAQCSAVFPDVIATHGNGVGNSQINFGYNARLINNPDTELSTRRVNHNSGSNINSCDSVNCTASNTSAETASVNFVRGGGTIDVNPGFDQTITFGTTSVNNYDQVNASSQATLNFSTGHNVYYFERLALGSNNVLNLLAGKTYYFRQFSVGSNTRVNVVGSGTAIVYVDSAVSFLSTSKINSPGINQSGNASSLVMHVNGNVRLNSQSTFSGALYANNINFNSPSYLFGVASGRKVNLNSNAILTYDNNVFNADFGEVCENSTPLATAIANFQFDECAYFGVGNEVVDQFGNYSGTSHNSVNTSVDAQIEKALDISSEQQHVQVNIPLPSTYSVSTWFKKPTDNSGNRFFILGAMASGGDLLYLDRDNGWRWGIYDATAGNSVDGNYSFNNLDNSWHHMALVYQNSQTKLYINGSFVEAINLAPSGTLKYIGTSFDDFGTSTPQGFRAPLDEFIVFDGALTADEVKIIYDHQSAGNNYDGSTRSAINCQSLLAHYAFEQTTFTSFIEDTSGAGNHGSNISGVSTANGKYCRGFDTNGSNGSAQTNNAFNSNVNLLDDVGRQGSISFWFNSNTTWNRGGFNGGGERTLFDASLDFPGNRDKYFTLKVRNNGRLRLSFEDSNDSDFTMTESNNSALRQANTWYHIAVTWDYVSGKFQMYVDGALIADQVKNTSGQITGLGDIIFGDNASTYSSNSHNALASNYSANGRYDDVRIYNEVINQAKIQADLNENDCVDNVIHHYEIVHDGNGLTCAAEPITIKACTNSSCSNLSTEPVSLDFTVNGVTKSPVTFTGSTSSNNPGFSFNHTTPEVLTLSVAGATVPATNPVQCTGSSCDMRFSDSEFRFLYGANNDSAIASQTSGVEFSGVKIQARKDENGECKGLFSGLKSVELWQENLPTDSSDTNVGLEFQIDGSGIGKNAASARSIALNFTTDSTGAESIANIPASVYLDAGKIRLRASYNQDDISLVGNSNGFWVRPDRFEINSTAQYNLSTDTYAAGKAFNFNIRALNRDGTVTQNYRQIDGELELKLVRVLPTNTASVDGFLTIAANTDLLALVEAPTNVFTRQTLTSFNLDEKGVSEFSSAKYSEVGNITVDVQDVKYGGLDDSGWVIPATEVTLGRFIPAYFEQTLNRNISGNLDSYHSAISGCSALNWAYTGQKVLDSESKGSIHYGIEPVIDITAYNAEKKPTKNYTLAEDINSNKILMKLSASGVTITSPVFDHKQLQVGGVVKEDKSENVAINSSMERGTLKAKSGVAGTMTYTFSELDRFSYVRNHLSFLKPFEAEIPFITEAVVDADGVTLRADNTPLDSTDNPTEDFTITGVNIRFARMVIENTFGPETSNLRVPLNVQTYNGTSFVQANDESCLTPLINAKKTGTIYSGNLNLWDYRLFDDASSPDAIEIGDTNASIVNGFLAGEHGDLLFSASQTQGALELEYEVPAWLKFDWQNLDTDNDGPYTDNPTAILNFGLYRGNDRIISWREVTN